MRPPLAFVQPVRGLTLVEACAVMAVLAILAASAVPSLQGFVDNRRLEGAATQLASDLQFARSEAVARNVALRISLHGTANGSCYLIHSGDASACDCDASGIAHCSGSAQAIKTTALGAADRVSLAWNATSLLFDPVHGTTTPTATLRIVGSRGQEIRHVVNVMGRVRSCSPNAGFAGYRAC